jgi:hypothetical protein
MIFSTKEIMAAVTGKNSETLEVFHIGDGVAGRGDMVGTVVSSREDGDLLVRWEDGEEWSYPPVFLTKLPFRDTELNSEETPELILPPVLDPREVLQTSENGAKKGTKPERFDLLPWDALEEVARVYHYGSQKYEARNWEKGYPWSWSFQALVRHVSRWMIGETYDKETGLHHMAHACFHALALVAFQFRNVGQDDRPDAS